MGSASPSRAARIAALTPAEKASKRSPGLRRQAVVLGGGKPGQIHGPRKDVGLERRLAEDLGQPARAAPAPQVHLEQPVLRHDVAIADEDVVVAAREHVRHAAPIAQDVGVFVDRQPDDAVVVRQAPSTFGRPPRVEIGAGHALVGADLVDRLACAEASEPVPRPLLNHGAPSSRSLRRPRQTHV